MRLGLWCAAPLGIVDGKRGMDGLGITKKYSSDTKLAELETKARTARAGLWADAKAPIATWDYRSLIKQQAAVKKGGAIPLGYWLNTSSNSRHNSACRYYQNTAKGRTCEKDEGKACGICGG